ncbi:MAG: biopolymer transporter ExbD [Planctomycetes bacterium]|nr:biopolymer transporter ExbD [Planctomycetota bacterium]
MSRSVRAECEGETRIEMTPMIDVTFLLLVFFLCAIQFKILEGKLQTYLPKDCGVDPSGECSPFERIDLRIERTETRPERDLERIEVFRDWQWSDDQVALWLQNARVKDLRQLAAELQRMRRALPAAAGQEDALRMTIAAGPGTIYEDVIRIVDVVLDAGITDVTFRGVALDS